MVGDRERLLKPSYEPNIKSAAFWGAILLVAFGFGTGYPATRSAILQGVPVPLVVVARNGGALILLTLYLALGRQLVIPRVAWRRGFVLGLVYQAAPSLFFAAGLAHVSAGYGAIVIGLIPLATAAIAHMLVANDRLSPAKLVGLVLGFAGVAVVFLTGSAGNQSGERPALGTVLLLVGVVSAGFGYVYARLHAPVVSLGQILLPQFLAATLLAFAVLLIGSGMSHWSSLAEAWFPVAWLAVISTFMTFLTLIWLLGRTSATRTVLVEYLVPPIGVIAGVVVLNEPLTWSILAGAVLIFCGLVVANRTASATSYQQGGA